MNIFRITLYVDSEMVEGTYSGRKSLRTDSSLYFGGTQFDPVLTNTDGVDEHLVGCIGDVTANDECVLIMLLQCKIT